MKILVVANSLWNITNFRLGLIKNLHQQGYEVHILAPQSPSEEIRAQIPVRFHQVSIQRDSMNPFVELIYFTKLAKCVCQLRPDFILSFTIKPNIYCCLLAKIFRFKVVCNITGMGYLFLGSNRLRKLAHFLYRCSLNSASKVLFQNKIDQAYFIENKLIDAKNTDTVPGSGINLAHFHVSPKPDRNKNMLQFLFIGRLLHHKGIVEFYQAACEIAKIHPNTQFAILGDIDTDNHAAINEAMLAEWCKHPQIEYLGYCDDVRPFIAQSDCVVLPSYREGTPRSLLEASAMGKPIIASDAPGCGQVVEPGQTGFLCETKSVKSLKNAMLKMLLLDHQTREQFGLNARRKMEQEYDEQFVIDSYLQLIGQR